jgi:hypothetical protein
MINNKLSEISEIIKNNLYYGYPYNCNEDLPLILLSYANTECFNHKETKKYKDLLNLFLFDCKIGTSEVSVDNTKREEWEKNNPACVSRKQWEKIALKICNQYRLEFVVDKVEANCEADITVEEMNTVCELAFDITKKIIDCEVITAISIQQKMCDLNITVERSKDECVLDYKILIEKYNTCELSLKEYITLIDEKFSFEIISAIYDKDLSLEVTSQGVYLKTPMSNYLIGKDIKFKEVIVDSTTKDIIFPENILSEYNITNKQKKNILNEIYFV